MKRSVLLTVPFAFVLTTRAADYVWVEAERAADKVEHANDWYEPVDRQTSLSGHDWWRTFDEKGMGTGYAVVPFRVEETGAYELWIRLNRSATGYRWALDDAPLQDLPLETWQEESKAKEQDLAYERRLFDESFASHDGSNRHRLIWVRTATLDLAAGEHRLRIEARRGAEGKAFAAVDCFVLAKRGFAFRPRLFYKPGETVRTVEELDPANAWAWPAALSDTFGPSPINLRRLNEKEAGEHGFIRRSDDGMGFVRGDGQPIRFWAGTVYAWRIPFRDGNLTVNAGEAERVAHDARWQAKRGINMVRFHGHLPPARPRGAAQGPARDGINETDLHGAWYMVAAYKKEGIYATISPYWGSHTDNEASWNLGFTGGNLAGLVFFYEPVTAMYRNWIKWLYTEANPYTGIPLKDDPAVAIIQLQNEDSLLFYTAARIQGEPLEALRRKFADFAAKKHGSLAAAVQRYEATYESDWDLRGNDSVEEGKLGLLQNWFFTQDARDRGRKWAQPGIRARLNDQLEFYTTLMRDWNAATARYLREELGCRQLINAGNWKTVDATLVEDAERYSYLVNEVVGKNAYYGSIHEGINNGWQILGQHVYANWSALKRPRFWPMNVKQPVGHPFILPESLWVPPNLYASEAALVVAGQLSLTGIDAFYWFCSGGDGWAPPNAKWPYHTPMQMGQFPATALAFREGFIRAADAPVVYEERSLADLWTEKVPLIAESPVYDPNRDEGAMPTEVAVQTKVDPLAFCVGPVHVRYGGDAASSRASPELATLVDVAASRLTSITGEIATDFAKGLYTVNAPRCQAAAGFLGQEERIALADVAFRCRNRYASLVVVPLDGRPIAASGRLLVQAGTVSRPSGWRVRERSVVADGKTYDGFQILNAGRAPELVEKTMATVEVANPKLRAATALDINGMPVATPVRFRREQSQFVVELPPDALYTILTGKEPL